MDHSTKAIHSIKPIKSKIQSVSTPIYLSTNYLRNPDGGYDDDLIYSRIDNPNRKIVEKSIAVLENGAVAYAFSSGMAAIISILQSLKSGDHIIIPDDVYYMMYKIINDTFTRWGLTFSKVNMQDVDAIKKAIKPNTSLIWMETPSNPMLKITDVRVVCDLASKYGVTTAVDNTWATPILFNPLDLGADIVIHSTTKYFGGHSDVLGGAVVCKKHNSLSERIHQIQIGLGAVPSPFDCWLVSRGIQTLSLRVLHQSKTALELAKYLDKHPKVSRVHYPGLDTHELHNVAKKQMHKGFGAMLSFQVEGDEESARKIAR